jgi:hypothetical protein
MFQNEIMTLHSIARFFASQRVQKEDQIEDRSNDDTSILVHANTKYDVQFTPSPACGAHLVITPQLHLLLRKWVSVSCVDPYSLSCSTVRNSN